MCLCGSGNKLRLLRYIALNDWFLKPTQTCLMRGTNSALYIIQIKLRPSRVDGVGT